MTDTVAELPLFPSARRTTCPFDPLAEPDRELFAGPPTRIRLPTGLSAWLVTGHPEVRELLRHPDFSADLRHPGFPLLRPVPLTSDQDRLGGFIRMDGAEHSRLRRMLTAEFTIRNVRRIEPLIERIVDDALDTLEQAGSPAELVESFALPVPSMVICHLLGVPYADHAFFQERSRTLLDRTTSQAEVRVAVDELRVYLRSLVEARWSGPEQGDDLISRLVTERCRTGELSADELVGMAMLLLIAGHETTANMIGLGTLLLLQHPDQLAALRADPGLADSLVEELLRYLSIVRFGLGRVALRDVEIGGQLIRAGEGAIALLSLANRDEAVFGDPEQFDLRREAHQHVAFGFGVHQCIGQPLARAELRIALLRLVRRFPGLRALRAPAEVSTRHDSVVYGLAELPVAW